MNHPMRAAGPWRTSALTILITALASAAASAQTGAPPSSQPAQGERTRAIDPADAARQQRPGQLGGQEASDAPRADLQPLSGRVLETSGRVRIKNAQTGEETDAKPGEILGAGARIRTGPNAWVTIELGKNSVVRVNSLTAVTIAQLAEAPEAYVTMLGLERGDMDVRVDRSDKANDFSVATPSATLAVAGTGFNVSHDAIDGTRVTGVDTNSLAAIKVAFHDGDEQAVGRGTISDAAHNPAVAALGRSMRTGMVRDAGRGGLDTRILFPTQSLAMVQATTGRVATLQAQALQANIMRFSDTLRGANEQPPFGGGPIP